MRKHVEGVSGPSLGQTQSHPLSESGCFLPNRSQHQIVIARAAVNNDQNNCLLVPLYPLTILSPSYAPFPPYIPLSPLILPVPHMPPFSNYTSFRYLYLPSTHTPIPYFSSPKPPFPPAMQSNVVKNR